MTIINGPTAPDAAAHPLYQVTLASGAILTRPTSFPDYRPESDSQPIIVTETGEVVQHY